MDLFTLIYSFLGGLGIFFYGMKTLSDGLAAMAGELIQKIINSLTTNRFLAVLVGIGVTCIVQSSSVTTVMVVGMVNAGLMKLTQAIGVIFGANIGTTITGWIISLQVSKFGLMFVGIGIFPTLFAPKESIKQIGRALFGVGLVFIGLDTMSASFDPLRESPDFLRIMAHFNKTGLVNILMNMALGCVLTMVVQSSSAMLGITMALAKAQLIQVHTAYALVLGENVGTTITAVLASIGGNIHAKRAARAHSIFNIVGVLFVLSIFPYYVELIDWFFADSTSSNNKNTGIDQSIEKHIAMAHSAFNITCTLLFLPFIHYYARFIEYLFPEPKEKQRSEFIFMGPNNADMVPATGIYQAKEELKKLKEIVNKMFSIFLENVMNKNHNGISVEHIKKIKHYEEITDRIQKEITVFTCKIMQHGLTAKQSHQCQVIVQLAHEMESIADYLERLIQLYPRFSKGWYQHSASGQPKAILYEKFHSFIQKNWNFYVFCTHKINHENQLGNNEITSGTSAELLKESEELRELYLQEVSKENYAPESLLIFSDFIMAIVHLKAHAWNISLALKY